MGPGCPSTRVKAVPVPVHWLWLYPYPYTGYGCIRTLAMSVPVHWPWWSRTLAMAVPYWRFPRSRTGGFPGPVLEVTAVYGITAVTSLSTSCRMNAITSNIDLADLSKTCPRWKLVNSSRAGMNFRVRLHFVRIVEFSEKDRLKHAPFWQNTRNTRIMDKTRNKPVFARALTEKAISGNNHHFRANTAISGKYRHFWSQTGPKQGQMWQNTRIIDPKSGKYPDY